jgi:hypothetical protein
MQLRMHTLLSSREQKLATVPPSGGSQPSYCSMCSSTREHVSGGKPRVYYIPVIGACFTQNNGIHIQRLEFIMFRLTTFTL